MTSIEYLSLSKGQRALVKIGQFFVNLWFGIGRFFKNLPGKTWKSLKKCANPFFVLKDAALHGRWYVRMNFLICGFTQFFHHQIMKGILYLLYEGVFIAFMITTGAKCLAGLSTLGYVGGVELMDPSVSIPVWIYSDNSFSYLLYSIVAIVLIVIMAALWYLSIRDAKAIQDSEAIGVYAKDSQFVKDLTGKNYHTVLLSIPMVGLIIFTIIPIIFMIVIGFTNYDSNHLPPSRLFDWVGFSKYSEIFTGGSANNTLFITTLGQVLAWTLIWAFFATFSNYFIGMVVALLINQKGLKLKKVWRTILITTIAVPQFVSLLLVSRMLNTEVGFFNEVLKSWGWISEGIHWLDDVNYGALLPKVMIILVNTWIGIPYTMLISTGILMNIPEDLYESARIDGASPFKMYMKITLPYMLFITTPYLISQFVGNINNFNVIYLLSGGNPAFSWPGQTVPNNLNGVGQTDLLITWIYKLTVDNQFKDYGMASVLGVLVFVVVAVLSLIFYNRSGSVKNEEEFQ